MLANVVEVKITPDFPALLWGFPTPIDRFATGVHDDLWAHCFYMKTNGGEEFAIVTMDLLYYSKMRVKIMRAKIEARTGIPSDHINVYCTHTHSAPITIAYRNKTAERELFYPSYLDEIENKVAGAFAKAQKEAYPAMIGSGKGYCGKEQGVGGNRRDKDGPCDPIVWVTAIKDLDGNPRGAIIRYSLHPTFLGADNTLITGDYPHYLYQTIKEKFPGIGVGFQNGTSGDQSSRHFRTGTTFEEAERVGSTIAKEAIRVIESMTYNENPVIRFSKIEVDPDMRVILPYDQALANAEKARHDLKTARETGRPIAECRTLECTVFGADHMLDYATIGKDVTYAQNAEHPFEISLVAIDDLRMLGSPAEMFVKYIHRMYEMSPFEKTYITCNANGRGRGYLCPPEAHAEGGYEALGSLYTENCGDIVLAAMMELLEKSKNL